MTSSAMAIVQKPLQFTYSSRMLGGHFHIYLDDQAEYAYWLMATNNLPKYQQINKNSLHHVNENQGLRGNAGTQKL